MLPLSLTLATPPAAAPASPARAKPQSSRQALVEAFGHRSYVLLVLGFFTCGFQLAFVTVHLPSYLVDRGLRRRGRRLDHRRHRPVQHRRLARLGLARRPHAEALPAVDHLFRPRALDRRSSSCCRRAPASTLIFGAVTGLLWLSTVPPTSGLVALMFGTRWLTMLFGFAFFSHQVGGFLGVWLGGLAVRGAPAPTTWCGGCRCSSASPPRSSTCRSSKSRWRGPCSRGRMNRCAMSARARHLAHAARHPDLRLPDRHDRLRAALDARLLPDADVVGQRLGPRRVRARARHRRCCCGARRSRSPARSPTASARCWVLCGGALLYAAGLVLDGLCDHAAGSCIISAGVLIGFGLAGCSFTLVLGAFGKLLPEEWRSLRVRRRHRGRLVRPVPVLAARGRADRRSSAGRTRC